MSATQTLKGRNSFADQPSCRCSWLKKLQLVKDILVDKDAGAPDLDTLANAYIYLQVCHQL